MAVPNWLERPAKEALSAPQLRAPRRKPTRSF